jgi:DNA polymerase III epsilon subunit family exonuclease
MALCSRCGASGFTLKVDSYSLCPICQRVIREEMQDRAFKAEKRVKELTSDLEDANKTIQAKDAEIAEFHRREKELENRSAAIETKKAAAEAAIMAARSAAKAEMEEEMTATQADCEAVLKNTNSEIAKVLRSALNRFEKYAETLPEPKAKGGKKKAGPTVKRSKFPLASAKSFFENFNQDGFIALDFETTGLSAKRDRIIEIGAVKVTPDCPYDSFSTYVNPGKPISPSATAVNGITDAMVADAPSESDAIRQLVDFIGDVEYIVAHNAPFDIGFLEEACLRSGVYLNRQAFDTLPYCRRKLRGLMDYKLETVAMELNIVNSDPHRALGDADTVADLVQALEPETDLGY